MSNVIIVTGSAGLIGSETVEKFAAKGDFVVGIDNDMRQYFFGTEASTVRQTIRLKEKFPNYRHYDLDIRDGDAIATLFAEYNIGIKLVVHTAAQPSHDWAAREPLTDFSVNATGTLNLLEATRQYAPDAVFVHLSTNKVYGDRPNTLPLVEQETRWSVNPNHPFALGINETMSIDQSTHSVFGASKVAADVLVQEYGHYFGLKTTCFRGGCLTGPNHSGAQLHGFLAYLMKCTVTGTPYTVFGYNGKQVRDNIHSYDLVNAIEQVYQNPRQGEVYNMGGGRYSNCSMLEAIALCEEISGQKLNRHYSDQNRIGDHIWYVSDLSRFESHYPGWKITYNIPRILQDIYRQNVDHWRAERESRILLPQRTEVCL